MRAIVKGFVVVTLGLAVLVGSPAISFARPKKSLNLCVCKCSWLNPSGPSGWGKGTLVTAGACNKLQDERVECVGTDGKSHRGRTAGGCEHKGTVATGLTPGTGGVLQPPANAPPGGVKPPVTPGQTQR